MRTSKAPASTSWRSWAAIVLAGIAGAVILLYFTREGVGIRGDSVRYVMGARNILAGNGFSRTSGGGEIYPETGFAPLLSVVLAGMGLLHIDLYAGSRLFHALLFGLNIFLIGAMVLRFTRSPVAGLIASLLFLSAPSVVEWHGWLMTEALFIFLTLLALFCLAHGLEVGETRFVILAAGLAGAASLARYVGVAIVPAGAAVIVLAGRGKLRGRVLTATAFSLLALAPLAGWMLRNQILGDAGFANREVLFHAIRSDLLRQYLFEAASWALPEAILAPRALRAIVALALLGSGPAMFLLAAWRQRSRRLVDSSTALGSLPWLSLFYILSYVVVLALNSLLLDAGTGTSAAIRYLTPVFAVLVPFELCTYHMLVHKARRPKALGAIAVVASVLLIVLSSLPSWGLVERSTLALGFTGIRERWAAAAADLEAMSEGHPIITNNPEINYYLIDRPAYIMPIKYDPYRLQAREDFPQQLLLARQRLEAGSILVVFQEPKEDEVEVLALLGVIPLRTYPDVVIYGYAGRGSARRNADSKALSTGPTAIGGWEKASQPRLPLPNRGHRLAPDPRRPLVGSL